MIRYAFLILIATVLFGCQESYKPTTGSNCEVPDHGLWNNLLQKHVDSTGWVSYAGFQADSVGIDNYLTLISSCSPNKNWSRGEQLAYWINAYNAFTVKLIIDHYPIAGIREIKDGIPFVNSVWDEEFFEIDGIKRDLNFIEHDVLRGYHNEPRIHFAIVCASASCPVLLNEAYDAKWIEDQLEAQTYRFVNDPTRNIISTEKLQLSSIFNWFTSDFTEAGNLQDFINEYSAVKVRRNTEIEYLDYDWSLNGD